MKKKLFIIFCLREKKLFSKNCFVETEFVFLGNRVTKKKVLLKLQNPSKLVFFRPTPFSKDCFLNRKNEKKRKKSSPRIFVPTLFVGSDFYL